jgi:hypothetical protein
MKLKILESNANSPSSIIARLFQFLQTVETKTCSVQRLENTEDEIGNFKIKCRLTFINNYKDFQFLQIVETKTCSIQTLENTGDEIGNFRIKCRLTFINNYKVFPILQTIQFRAAPLILTIV